jgi:hypothetical protein
MQPKATISFVKRGLSGLLLIVVGLTLSIVFNKHSAYAAELKRFLHPLALLLAVGGSSLVSSYVRQRSFKNMKTELLATGVLLATLVLVSLSNG